MVYTPTNWVDGSTPLNRTNMMNIENELALLDPRVPTAPAPVLSATPPGSPVDGQLWFFPADAAGTVWQFRYNAGSASAYKWEFVGGAALVAAYLAAQPVGPATTWVPGAPYISIPRNGEYLIDYSGIWNINVGAAQCHMGAWTTTTIVPSSSGYGGNGEVFTLARPNIGPVALAAGTSNLQMAYWTAVANNQVQDRLLGVRPVRVS
jgi:hypothetical protein